jgi:opacity protein-like surface antigen
LCIVAPVAADEPGPRLYAGLQAGAAWNGDLRFRTSGAALADVIEAHPAAGWSIAGMIGNHITNAVSVSLDLDHSSSSVDGVFIRAIQPRIACVINGVSQTCPPPSIVGRLNTTTAVLTAHYDFAMSQRWTISTGVGAGLTRGVMRITTQPATILPAATKLIDTDDSEFAASASLELRYAISSRLSLTGAYRYLHVDAPRFDSSFGQQSFAADRSLSSHVVRLGARAAF